jgi:putative addiction module component (TIGR02574 family)
MEACGGEKMHINEAKRGKLSQTKESRPSGNHALAKYFWAAKFKVMNAAEILEAAKALPPAERIKLAQDFLEIIVADGHEPDLTPEQAAELDRRLAEFEKNPNEGIPWEQIEAGLNKRFGWE